MKYLLLVLCAIGISCANNNIPLSAETITKKHYQLYVSTDNRTNTTIAISLRYISNDLQVEKPENWTEIESRINKFIEKIQNNNISLDYPVQPSKEEINLINNFLIHMIAYEKNYSEIDPWDVGENLSYLSSRYIKLINDWEYEKYNQ